MLDTCCLIVSSTWRTTALPLTVSDDGELNCHSSPDVDHGFSNRTWIRLFECQ